jgi:hypothetical protein
VPALKESLTRLRRSAHAVCARRWNDKEEAVVRKELYEPLFERLGFKAKVNRPATSDQTQPDYLLKDAGGKNVTRTRQRLSSQPA